MGDVIGFHARASAGAAGAVGSAVAKDSKVTSWQPFSPANRTKDGHRFAGIPRVRHPLTTDGLSPKASERAPVPPSASITVPAVNAMEANIVRAVRTCQVFADGETTLEDDYGSLGPMIDPPEIIGPRLRALRIALGFKTQVAFAKRLELEKNTYNPYETGSRELSFETACIIRRKFKIPLDYLFWGDLEDQLPAAVSRKLGKAA